MIGLAICIAGGTESGTLTYVTKFRKNLAEFPNWLNLIKSRKVKGKAEELFLVQKH